MVLVPYTNAVVYFFRYRKVFNYTDRDIEVLQDSFDELKMSNCLKSFQNFLADDICKFWGNVSNYQVGTDKPFSLLSTLALGICVIPHSNAGPERFFSMIRKNLRSDRSCIKKDTTLNSLMILKTCELSLDFIPSSDLLKKAKTATRLALLDAAT